MPVEDTLVSVLRQLRPGYDRRSERFPQSVVLGGVRDVRDHRIHTGSGEVVLGGSAFNITAESVRLGDFSEHDAGELPDQRSEDTGQVIADEAKAEIREQTCGQPWLVNALAYEACFRTEVARDRSRPITTGILQDARESLILRRDTRLDRSND